MVRIENWKVVSRGDGFTPPEMHSPVLSGQVYEHPHFEDGSNVTSSRILKVDGRTVTTYSGRVYTLGEPDPEYVEWCTEQRYDWNEDNPIRWRQA